MTKKTTEQLFRTPVNVAIPLRKAGVADRFVFLGSCFAEHIGARFLESRLQALVNPLGVMYNPMSIARLLTTSVSDPNLDYVSHRDMVHTWLGDSTLSRPTAEACRQTTDQTLEQLHTALNDADYLFLTLGTSRYYVYRATSGVVANCHQLPGKEFMEKDLSVSEIVECLGSALEPLFKKNPHLHVVFTVSPYRYAKYGFHESQLSKARLLLAVEELSRLYPDKVEYFPAYEILMDELRDYRFYAEDMLHPSQQAVDYIWQRLTETWMEQSVLDFLDRWKPVRQALNHRPINADDPAYKVFQQNLNEQLAALRKDYPFLSL